MKNKIKFIVSGIRSNESKQRLEELGLYCYDLRDSDDGRDIAIELGDKYPNDFIDYNTFVNDNVQVDKIADLLENKKNKINERGR